jgi:predicted regulator of Ras-like GTPase activity (Roadblock/LC7/MglB family)
MAARTEKIQEVLRSLRVASPDIIGSAVVSNDGFIIASLLPSEIDEEVVSAMAAAMLGVSDRISNELMGAPPDQTYVRSGKGYVILNSAGPDSILIVLTTAEAKLGLVFLDIKRRVAELIKAL